MQRMWSTYLDAAQAQQQQEYSELEHSRPESTHSSVYSAANSTRHMLAKPNPPFAPSAMASSNGPNSPLLRAGSPSAASLTVNYLPSKFSDALVYNGLRRRQRAAGGVPGMPKRGGGTNAFKAGEARVAAEGDEDYDGVQGGWFGGQAGAPKKTKLSWNRFKWILFLSNIIFTGYTIAALIFALCTWFNVFHHADIILVANRTELVLSTIAASLGVLTALIGWAGILLNNRAFLAVYTFMLWIVFAFLVTPGYLTYKNRNFNLSGKVNQQWSQLLGVSGWLRVQNQLQCCGFFSPFVEAAISQTCYSRSVLPGCKGPLMDFERDILAKWYAVAFGLVPVQIFCIIAGLLCSNHVTYRFGKGMTPKAYRLDMSSMAVIMDNYANQLAEQYGAEVASEAMARSRSNLNLDSLPTVPYSPGPDSPRR
ncbi:tetraspanin Tsp2 [Peniophora sp. CONT]|nr:tetraspanin Tsp2 [Peniophora sp. CONT]